MNSQCTNIHPDDLAALQELYRSTDGDHWTDNAGWDQIMNTSTPVICDLTSINGLNFSGDRVVGIYLQNNNLDGTIPASLGGMTDLSNIDQQFERSYSNRTRQSEPSSNFTTSG